VSLRTALVALTLVAGSLVGVPAAAAAPAAGDVAVVEQVATAEVERRIPGPGTITACFRSMGTLGTCLAEGIAQACAGSWSAAWKCLSKVYGGYRAARKVMDLRADPRCPQSLGPLAAYLCSPRVPTAAPVFVLTVDAQTRRLNVFTGPGTWFTLLGSYPDGARVGVVCVARFGERVTDVQILRSSTYWARLANGSFISWVYLTGPIGTRVPFC
jgi:hypothetical protein